MAEFKVGDRIQLKWSKVRWVKGEIIDLDDEFLTIKWDVVNNGPGGPVGTGRWYKDRTFREPIELIEKPTIKTPEQIQELIESIYCK